MVDNLSHLPFKMLLNTQNSILNISITRYQSMKLAYVFDAVVNCFLFRIDQAVIHTHIHKLSMMTFILDWSRHVALRIYAYYSGYFKNFPLCMHASWRNEIAFIVCNSQMKQNESKVNSFNEYGNRHSPEYWKIFIIKGPSKLNGEISCSISNSISLVIFSKWLNTQKEKSKLLFNV